MYCAVLALGLTALGLLLLAAGVVVAPFAVLIGLVLLTPAVLMWTAIVRLATHPPRGAVLLLATVATAGAVLTILGVLPVQATIAMGISGMRQGTVVVIGLLHLGGAALLAAQVFGRSRNGTASTHPGDDQ